MIQIQWMWPAQSWRTMSDLEWVATSICFSLAQMWRTRTVVWGDQVLDSACGLGWSGTWLWLWWSGTWLCLWSGVIRYLTLTVVIRYLTLPVVWGDQVLDSACGLGWSGTWLWLWWSGT
jgi:hypothetical protein